MNFYPPATPGKWINDGLNLYKTHFSLFLSASVILVLLSILSLGILLPPLATGFARITTRLNRNDAPRPKAADIFDGFRFFINAFLFMVFWGLVMLTAMGILAVFPVIGQVAALFAGYCLQALLMFGLFLIGDKNMSFWQASNESMAVVKTDFWPFFGVTVLAGILGGIGAIGAGIGIVLTLPIQFCIIASAYKDLFQP
ncbi:MAG: hypothetical protein SWH61_12005 [Thermodesulfobacteriota bacterium]|nr:hypothetical protein [Thermodesulfobacteriota bacterium]